LKGTSRGPDQIQSAEQASELRYLLDKSRELLSGEPSVSRNEPVADGFKGDKAAPTSPQQMTGSSGSIASQGGSHGDASTQGAEEEPLDLDDAENPLQLLARTSELLSSMTPQMTGSGLSWDVARSGLDQGNDLQRFFGGFRPRLDVGEDLDPIDLGLMTLAEAEALFT
jgi:hypothetical protein